MADNFFYNVPQSPTAAQGPEIQGHGPDHVGTTVQLYGVWPDQVQASERDSVTTRTGQQQQSPFS